jgi:5-methylcytosine-specific restriction enzyme subunit McrC
MTIPIRNLYYIFTYAWARFPAGNEVPVGIDECPDLHNLLAKLLIDGTNRLIRRGLDRGYEAHREDIRSPRGRLILDEIIKRQTLQRGQVVCEFDELTHDVLHNQILKATIRMLARAGELEKKHRHELELIARRLEEVADIHLQGVCFRRVQLSRNTREYGLLLQICELIFRSLMPEETGGGARFADILKNEARMSTVFEEFLKNFYTHEQDRFTVGSEVMTWEANPLTPGALSYLPTMRTDLTLRSPDRVIVADAKYYTSTLAHYHGGSKVHSGNLYQLYTYLRHTAARNPAAQADGLLIYPAVKTSLRLDYELPEHRIRVATVDLTQPWQEIHDELLQLLFEDFAGSESVLAA